MSDPERKYWDVVEECRRVIAQLVSRAEELCQRLPEFQRIETRRSRAEAMLGRFPQKLVDDGKRRRWAARTRKLYEARNSEYVAGWQHIADFTAEVQSTFEELRIEHRGSDGKARKVLSNAEVDSLVKEIYAGRGGLGALLPSTLRALRIASQMIDDLGPKPSRQPLREEIENWATKRGLIRNEDVARALSVGQDILKSLKAGNNRHGVETERRIRRLIGLPES